MVYILNYKNDTLVMILLKNLSIINEEIKHALNKDLIY